MISFTMFTSRISRYLKSTVFLPFFLCVFLINFNPVRASEDSDGAPWVTTFQYSSERLSFSVVIVVNKPRNGVYYQVLEDGRLYETITYSITFHSNTGDVLLARYRPRKNWRGDIPGESKIGYFPEDTPAYFNIWKQDYICDPRGDTDSASTWEYQDYFIYFVKLYGEEADEKNSTSGKLEYVIPLGWRTEEDAKYDTEAPQGISEIAPVSDEELPSISIVIPKNPDSADSAKKIFSPVGIFLIISLAVLAAGGILISLVIIFRKKAKNNSGQYRGDSS